MTVTNFPNGISSYGIPVMGGGYPIQLGANGVGQYFFVDATNGSDGNSGLSPDNAVKTIAQAYSLVTSNRHDTIVLSSNSTHTLTAVLDITKNRVNFIGADFGVGRTYGLAAKVNIGVTTASGDIAAIKNTGVRNTFRNMKISSGNTLTEGKYVFAEGGEYTFMQGIELYFSAQTAVADAAELLMNGDSFQGEGLTIGSLATAVTANGAHPCIMTTRETITGKVARDVIIKDSQLWRLSQDADNRFIHGTGATDIERQFRLINVHMNLAKNSTTTMALAVHSDAALTNGRITLEGDTQVVGDVTSVATQTGIFVEDKNVLAGKAGKMLQAVAQ